MNFNLDMMVAYQDEVLQAIKRVVESHQYILGKEGRKFECAFGEFVNQAHVVGVGNGTDAIRIGLLALGVRPGDEVISSAFNVAYTALAVHAIGAKNVFVDCDPDTLLMDVDAIALAVTPQTKAIVPVHLYGQMVNMKKLRNVARGFHLMVLEDAAQAHGAAFDHWAPGSWSDAVAYSFYPTKNLGALGEAGALTTNIASVAERAQLLRDGGRTDRYLHFLPGINSCLDEMQAAVLNVKLPHLYFNNGRRGCAAAAYRSELKDVSEVRMVGRELLADHVYHLFVIRAQHRDELREYLELRGIPTLIHYPVPVPYQPCFMTSTMGGPWPNAEAASREVISLPMHPDITARELLLVTDAIKDFYHGR
jgi:dTDP-4-amino-4,6-dideoxygalactose transaminase